jgi:hypothetical protein
MASNINSRIETPAAGGTVGERIDPPKHPSCQFHDAGLSLVSL